MLRIKHKELAEILGVSKGYSQVLLHRKGLKLTNQYLKEIIDLIITRKQAVKGRPNELYGV